MPSPASVTTPAVHVIPFRELDISRIAEVGGKNASLGELITSLEPKGSRVPDGFAITATAFRQHLQRSGLEDRIYAELDALDVTDRARHRTRSQEAAQGRALRAGAERSPGFRHVPRGLRHRLDLCHAGRLAGRTAHAGGIDVQVTVDACRAER